MKKNEKVENKKVENKKVEKIENATKSNESFDKLASELIETFKNGDKTKKSIVTVMIKNGYYTTTKMTDTVNSNDLYIQLNDTDKPRIWLRKNGFNLQYDKYAKRENKTEIYENIGKKYDFKYRDTPSFQNRNRTSDIIDYKHLSSIMSELFTLNILSKI